MRLLARRDRSEQEMRARLAAAGQSEATITATIRRLRQRRYLDDQRFALATAEQAVRRGYGSDYLRARLQQYGIADGLVAEVVESAYGHESALARTLFERRFPVTPHRPSERAKAARFLLRRGFPEAVVFAILGEDC